MMVILLLQVQSLFFKGLYVFSPALMYVYGAFVFLFMYFFQVVFGKNGTLSAMVPGKVLITCEKVDLNWEHTWVERCYNHRRNTEFYKKYFNVLPEPQHKNFKLIDQI